MTKIYYKTFAQSDLDRERDEALSQRMAALSFVSPEHLDIPKQYHEESAWLRAIQELHKINSYKVQLAVCCWRHTCWRHMLDTHGGDTHAGHTCTAGDTHAAAGASQMCLRGKKKKKTRIKNATCGITSMQAPRDKLVCVLNCCRVINNLLHVADNNGNEARGEHSPFLICTGAAFSMQPACLALSEAICCATPAAFQTLPTLFQTCLSSGI